MPTIPFSPKFLMGFSSDAVCSLLALPVPELIGGGGGSH